MTNMVIYSQSFKEKVISDFGRYSFYLPVNINSSGYKGKAIIENDDLFIFLHLTKGLSKEQYQYEIKELLKENSILNVGNIDLNKWNFIPVQNIKEINEYSEKGINTFLKKYFKDNILKDNVSEEKMASIINQLFKWDIGSKIDDESGCLVIFK